MLWILIAIGIVIFILALTVFGKTDACAPALVIGGALILVFGFMCVCFFCTYLTIKESNPKKIAILEQNNIEITGTIKNFESDSMKLSEPAYSEFVSKHLDILANNNEEIKKLRLELNDLAMYKVLLFLPDTKKLN